MTAALFQFVEWLAAISPTTVGILIAGLAAAHLVRIASTLGAMLGDLLEIKARRQVAIKKEKRLNKKFKEGDHYTSRFEMAASRIALLFLEYVGNVDVPKLSGEKK
jgi:hypothetical protein